MSVARPLIVGLSSGALYPNVMTEDALTIAADLGFCVVELSLQTVGEYHPLFLAEIQKRASDLGLTVYALHIHTRHYHFWSDYRRRRDEAAALFAEAVHMAASLGARCIDWHGLTQAEIKAGVTVETFLDTAAALGERAASAGVVLSLENVSWCWMRGAAEIARVRQAGAPVGFTFDPFQAADAQSDPLAIVGAMGDRVTNVHASDYAPGRRHLPVSEGNLDWHALLSVLRATGYGGPLILEAPQTGGESFIMQRRYLEGIRD